MLHHDKKLWPKIKDMIEVCQGIEGLKIHPHFLYGNTIQKLFNYRKDFWEYFAFLENYEKDLAYDDELFNDFQVFRDKMTDFYGWSCYNNNYEIDVRGNVVKFNVEESFLRADTMKRLEAIEKMLALGLIDVEQAKEMEDMSPNGNESYNVS
jgi:uncharacterized protein YktB (UPF0637 family)